MEPKRDPSPETTELTWLAWEDQLVSALRSMIRAVDSRSRQLRARYGLTTPQLLVLRQLALQPFMTAGQLARAVQLGQPTVKVIVDRLEERRLVDRTRDERDRRTIRIRLTEAGRRVAKSAPSLLHDAFRQELDALEEWERMMILSVMQRVGSMLDRAGRADSVSVVAS